MPHGVLTEAVARPSEPEKEIKPRETCGQEGCIVKQAKRPGANRPSARRAKALDGDSAREIDRWRAWSHPAVGDRLPS